MPAFSIRFFQRWPALVGGRDLVRVSGSFCVVCFVGGYCVAFRWCPGVRSVVDDVSDFTPFVCEGYCLFVGQRHSADLGLGFLLRCLPHFRAFDATGEAVKIEAGGIEI